MPDALDIYSGNNNGRPLDVACAKREGIGLVIPKATEGTRFRDPCFAPVYQSCHELGVRTGGYHFVRPDYTESARAEALYFVAMVRDAGGPHPGDVLACDFESFLSTPWPLGAGEPSIGWLLEFLTTVEDETGVVPWQYMNWNFLVNILRKDERLRRFPLWYANPAANWPDDWPPALHQYGYADVPCGSGVCDANNYGPAYHDEPAPPPPTAKGGIGMSIWIESKNNDWGDCLLFVGAKKLRQFTGSPGVYGIPSDALTFANDNGLHINACNDIEMAVLKGA